jgi:uncharacterized cupin superfamily protein
VRFDGGDGPFPELGINIRALQPGLPNGLYHSENSQEDFLVLGGECLGILDGEDRSLRAWDSCTARPGRRTCSWERGRARAGS